MLVEYDFAVRQVHRIRSFGAQRSGEVGPCRSEGINAIAEDGLQACENLELGREVSNQRLARAASDARLDELRGWRTRLRWMSSVKTERRREWELRA